MVIKASNKGYHSVSLSLNIDWEKKEITVEVSSYLKDGSARYVYSANELASALEKFDELDSKIRGEQD